MNIKSVSYDLRYDRFDFCSSKKEWCLTLRVRVDDEYISLYECFDLEPRVDGEPPTVVLDIIEERVKERWSSMRSERLATITRLRGICYWIDRAWAVAEAERYERLAKRFRNMVAGLDDDEADRLAGAGA